MIGKLPSVEVLEMLFECDAERGALHWKARPATKSNSGFNGKLAGKPAGSPHPDGYRMVKIAGRSYGAHRIVWKLVHGSDPEAELDHVNGDTFDNRIANLRQATHQQNCVNRRKRSDNTSGHKGVHFNKHTGKWQAVVNYEGRRFYLGEHTSLDAAAEVVMAKRAALHGAFARA